MPLTPNSSVGSEDPSVRSSVNHQSPAYPPPDLRRLSVQSLVNDTPDSNFQEGNLDGDARRRYPVVDSVSTTYGYDLGLPDFDTPRNKDDSAISIFSPELETRELHNDFPFDDAEPRTRDMAFGKGGYYAKPVQIRIPKSLEPLPPILMENKMNLLYFHHFINHTARILVPHDCEKNPFRQILPESNNPFQSKTKSTVANAPNSGRSRRFNHEPTARLLRFAPGAHAGSARTQQPHRVVGSRCVSQAPAIACL